MSQSWLQGFTYSYGGGDRRWRRLELFLTFKRYTLQRTYDECFIIFPPVISGSIKHHKQGNPVRPIVSSIGSALYNTSKFLTDILSPLQNCNGFSVPNSAKCLSVGLNLVWTFCHPFVTWELEAATPNMSQHFARGSANACNILPATMLWFVA